MRAPIDPEQWTAMLSGDLPGEAAQLKMAPQFRGEFEQGRDPIKAAVLILLYPSNGLVHTVFMKRNAYDGPHSAQVSFPGGRFEAEDQTLRETALRETREELGIDSPITVLGSLTDILIQVSNFLVSPFVGWTAEPPDYSPDSSEVQYLIECSLEELLDPRNRSSEELFRHGRKIIAPFYAIRGEMIWGATAMMLSEFLQLVARMQ